MRMFASYEHQPTSPALSSCDMASIDEMSSPSIPSSQHSIHDDLTLSTRLNTTALQNSLSLRFKVSLMAK